MNFTILLKQKFPRFSSDYSKYAINSVKRGKQAANRLESSSRVLIPPATLRPPFFNKNFNQFSVYLMASNVLGTIEE